MEKDELFKGIDKRISERLKHLQIKQADLCRETNISNNAISNYVSGNRIPDTLSTYKLSKALGVTMEWLLTGEVIPTNENSKDIADNLPQHENELLLEYRKLNCHDKKEMLAYIKMKLDFEMRSQAPPSSISKCGNNSTGEEAITSDTA